MELNTLECSPESEVYQVEKEVMRVHVAQISWLT